MTTTPETSTATKSGDLAADYGVLRWLVAATFIVILNETIMINAIPRLTAELDVTKSTAQWLTSAFMLTMAVVIPITGWFLQRVTTRQAFGSAMAVFATGTLLCGLAPTFEVLLAGRIIQASGTAIMMPLLMTTLMTIVAEQDRGRVMGNVTLAMSVAPALGPTVSGVILDVASWRWMFFAVLPISIAIALVGLRKLTDVGETRPGDVDWASVVLSALGFGPLVYGLSELGGADGATWKAWLALAIGVAAIAAFVFRQLSLQRTGTPLLDLRTLQHRTFTIGLLLMAVAFMAMLGSMILLPFYLQDVHGLDELQSGLMVMPGGLAMGLLGPQVGKIYDRVGGRPLLIPGSVGILVALTLFTQVTVEQSVWLVLPVHVLLMVSLAAVFTPVFTLSLGSLPPHLYSHGSSTLGALQQVAAAAGTAIVIAVLTARSTSQAEAGADGLHALVSGMRWGFGVGAVLGVAVLVLALMMPGRVSAQEGAAAPAVH
ncbi:MDR family MFS transporter [Nocardioides sp.]|uniref:MDR family MFS transporter n=1 Tax=Nocardioides sp. TaxID=35761 RepID=UPI0027222C70|nr:MDR family MFS transporter [Nocardioides sp.]MDO9457280.1 MDR family MFS transporter [Nocardioides sp.]